MKFEFAKHSAIVRLFNKVGKLLPNNTPNLQQEDREFYYACLLILFKPHCGEDVKCSTQTFETA
jgi:hypothetical protein